eukprot:Opistho-1_new@73946
MMRPASAGTRPVEKATSNDCVVHAMSSLILNGHSKLSAAFTGHAAGSTHCDRPAESSVQVADVGVMAAGGNVTFTYTEPAGIAEGPPLTIGSAATTDAPGRYVRSAERNETDPTRTSLFPTSCSVFLASPATSSATFFVTIWKSTNVPLITKSAVVLAALLASAESEIWNVKTAAPEPYGLRGGSRRHDTRRVVGPAEPSAHTSEKPDAEASCMRASYTTAAVMFVARPSTEFLRVPTTDTVRPGTACATGSVSFPRMLATLRSDSTGGAAMTSDTGGASLAVVSTERLMLLYGTPAPWKRSTRKRIPDTTKPVRGGRFSTVIVTTVDPVTFGVTLALVSAVPPTVGAMSAGKVSELDALYERPLGRRSVATTPNAVPVACVFEI